MGRLLRLATSISLLLVFAVQGEARADTVRVASLNFVFTPDPVKVQLGDTVEWYNDTPKTAHNAKSTGPSSLFDSGRFHPGEVYDFTFTAAGQYPYVCVLHVDRWEMAGTVSLKDEVFPREGPAGTIFNVRVATIDAPTDFVYDVQKKDPAGSWQDWMIGMTSATTLFDSTGQPVGTYQFRSRLRDTAHLTQSKWSLSVAITVTG